MHRHSRSFLNLGIIASLIVSGCGSEPAAPGDAETTGGDSVGGTDATSDVPGSDTAGGSILAALLGE